MDVTGRILVDLERKIEDFGWASMGIRPGDGDPTFTYTVAYKPAVELIIVGLDPAQANAVLHSAFDVGITAPGEYADVIVGFNVIARRVTSHHESFAPRMARVWRRYLDRPEEFDFYQLVWPDAQGVFPPDPAYDSGPQPLLPRP